MNAFVKEIIFFNSDEAEKQHHLPFYADGFAGIVFSQSNNPFYILPQNKKLSNFYLYGQTIIPMSLNIKGAFEVFAIRLFPFAVNFLIGVDTKQLNDDCYDLVNIPNINTNDIIDQLDSASSKESVMAILSDYFELLLKNAARNPDHRIVLATNLIINSKGNIKISALRERLHITERTLERQFIKETGVSPIQYVKIIQFQNSMQLISDQDYLKLSDIGFKSGYADQSHFIRNFKKYTGKTPKEFQQHHDL